MTDKEWQELARATKKDNTYFMLIKAITHFAENHIFGTKNKSVIIKSIINHNRTNDIKVWYKKYFFSKVYLKR